MWAGVVTFVVANFSAAILLRYNAKERRKDDGKLALPLFHWEASPFAGKSDESAMEASEFTEASNNIGGGGNGGENAIEEDFLLTQTWASLHPRECPCC